MLRPLSEKLSPFSIFYSFKAARGHIKHTICFQTSVIVNFVIELCEIKEFSQIFQYYGLTSFHFFMTPSHETLVLPDVLIAIQAPSRCRIYYASQIA